MNMEEFVTRFPGPPPIQRGERRHVVSVSLNEAEYDAVTRLAHHPVARTMYGGQLSVVVRHALQPYLWPMEELIEAGFKPLGARIQELLETASFIQNEKQIIETLDNKARHLHLLYTYDGAFSALDEYDAFLDFVESLGGAWSKVFSRFMSTHIELQAFRERVQRAGDDEMMTLKGIEEKPR